MIEHLKKKYSKSILKNLGKWEDSEFDKDELEKGTEIEMEHTDDSEAAKQIAKDHLDEISDYYTRLIKMEEEAELSPAQIEEKEEEGKEPGEADIIKIRKFILDNEGLEDYEFHEYLKSIGVNPHAGEEEVYKFVQDLASMLPDPVVVGEVASAVDTEKGFEELPKEKVASIKTYLENLL